ncbi:hypothetical protein, partial [Nostoc foliaceum]|uniref:hypothetical protein n=1 Tax=Nostoc foliaceum TaxID=2692914 RepID=UPI001A7E1EED
RRVSSIALRLTLWGLLTTNTIVTINQGFQAFCSCRDWGFCQTLSFIVAGETAEGCRTRVQACLETAEVTIQLGNNNLMQQRHRSIRLD